MKLTIYRKVMIGFGIVIVLMSLASAYVLVELQHVSQTTRSTLTIDVHVIDMAKQMRTILYEEERYAQKYLIARDTSYHAIFAENNRLFNRLLDSLSSTVSEGRERNLVLLAGERHDWHFMAVSRAAHFDPGASERERTEAVDQIHKSLDELIIGKQRAVSESMESVDKAMQRALRVSLLVAVGTLLAAIATALIITGTITRPIRTLVKGTKQIAGGSFARIRVRSHDEIADLAGAFNSMSESLDALNRFRAEMMMHISHELRMPLQTMYSAYYLLTEQRVGLINDEQTSLLKSMRDNIDKIAKFSNQFLDLSKVEAGMMEYNLERIDLAELVKPVVEDAGLTASRKEITLTFTPSPAPPVLVDVDKCSQITSNLLSNALKYTDDGGSVEVAVGPCPRGIRLSVQDTGGGIPPEELTKVFTKFYRATSAVKGRKKGTGIGLAFVKALVEGQKGTVYATSVVGRGSTFTVEFPTADAVERKPAS